MNQFYSIEELVSEISEPVEIIGTSKGSVRIVSSLLNSSPDAISFCSGNSEHDVSKIKSSNAGVIICSKQIIRFFHGVCDKNTYIFVENPRLAFIKILQKYFVSHARFGISDTAVVSSGAVIHSSVYIGDFTTIGNCSIGSGTIVHNNVYIGSNVHIGSNVTIHPFSSIGPEDAFAYERDEQGKLLRFPHFGGVWIENNVDIHPHVNIDRGTFEDTYISEGSKINRFSHIGHNSFIGKHCMIGGKCFIAGSCHIGNNTEIAFCSSIKNKSRIGSEVIIGMGSVVTEDVPDGWVVYGVPAKKIRKRKSIAWGNL